MRTMILISFVVVATLCMLPVTDALGRGFGGGGFHGGGFGGGGFHGGDFGGGGFHASSFHAGGFSGGFGSVQHASASHYGPATGFTHIGGTSYQGSYGSASTAHYGSTDYASHGTNYGSISHYDSSGAYGHTYTYGGYGAGAFHGGEGGSTAAYKTPYSSGVAVEGPGGNEAAAVKGPYGGTAAGYKGQYTSGATVRGPEGYGAAAVKGPYGGTAAAYHGPYGSGAVASLPSGYTAAAWHGTTYYHSGYTFYEPHWYGGSVYYYPTAAPVGWFFAALPAAATETVVAGSTYYVADGVYYQPTTQNGQTGYAVVDAPPSAPTPQATASTAPDPFQSLQKLSDHLGSQQQFLIRVDETYDEMALAGEKLQLSSQRTIRVERPDKMSVEVTDNTGDQKHIVFNGKDVTIIDKTKNTYGIIPVEGTLDAALNALAKDYGMAPPAADLLYSDLYAKLVPQIKTGQFLGVAKIAGKLCNHFTYVQTNLSWQIWMDQGDKPVPRKLVISYDDMPGRPQYTILVTKWDAQPEQPWDFKAKIPTGATMVSAMSLEGRVVTAPQP